MQVLLGAVAVPAFSPVQRTYVTGSGTETAPAGASNVIIAVWGGGASGNVGVRFATEDGLGGGAGGYAQSTYTISGGQTIAYAVGAGAAPSGNNGVNSTASSGTKAITTMTGGGGGGTGTGGTASGGTTQNTTGGAGGIGVGGAPVTGWNGNSAGAGGAGGAGGGASNTPGFPGDAGAVIFYYT